MKAKLTSSACDPGRLAAFLRGDLSAAAEGELTAHLTACASCRDALDQEAAEPQAWQEAARLLAPSEFDASEGGEFAAPTGLQEPAARRPLLIQTVLDALQPTDDPAMLGRLAGYEVSGVVGAGGMGVVLKAIDRSLDRTVAIKVLAPNLAASGAARQRFAREAKAAAAVLHPNVIAIHGVSNDGALPYLVMPYLRGASLQKRLDERGPLPVPEILRIGAQIAAGLAAAHAQGLVHRDIKPANILLEEGVERVAITDFGLARAVDDATLTASGTIAGTPQYMSPEQARGDAVDQRSDLFSLGSVLYAACTGRPPFRAETSHGVLRRITDDEPTPIGEINPEIPIWLAAIVARLMAKRPADRFASAGEVAELLEKCLAHVQQPAKVSLPAGLPVIPRSPGWRSALIILGVLAMFAAIAMTVAGIALLATDPPPTSDENTAPDAAAAKPTVAKAAALPEKLFATKDHIAFIEQRIKDAPVTTNYLAELFERTPGSPGEYRLRSDVVTIPILPAGRSRLGFVPLGKVYYLPASKGFYLQWDDAAASTLHYYGPFYGVALHKLGQASKPAENEAQPKEAGAEPAMPKRVHQFETALPVHKIACSADGKLIAIANGSPTLILMTSGASRVEGNWRPAVEILDAATGKTAVKLQLSTAEEDAALSATERVNHFEVTALAFAPAGDAIAVGTSIGQVKLFNANCSARSTIKNRGWPTRRRRKTGSPSFGPWAACGRWRFRRMGACWPCAASRSLNLRTFSTASRAWACQ